MSREKQGYRDNMLLLNERFPDKGMLSREEVAGYVGASVKTVQRRGWFPRGARAISKADLARLISQ